MPLFWMRPAAQRSWQSALVSPLAAIYARATAYRVSKPPKFTSKVPVICVGNINIGGSGKTPVTIALVEHLKAKGLVPHVVSRGYGGNLLGPVEVLGGRQTAADVGDEPLLLAAYARTWISKDRAAGVKAAEDAGADVILMDDGFQNPTVAKSLSIVVVDAEVGFGNGRVIPAGPLREPVQAGLKRANLVLSIGIAEAQDAFELEWSHLIQCPIAIGQLSALQTGMDWQGLRVLAFAGIGRPEKFFATVRSLGCEIIRMQPLDDHQPLTAALMRRLELEAAALSAQLVTTEKDAVRLPENFRSKVLTVPVRLKIADWTVIDTALSGIGIR